jgi:hypothetical protein
MSSTVITFDGLEHNRDELKQAAATGPVFVVDGDRPDLVVLSFDAYERLTTKAPNLAAALTMPFEMPASAQPHSGKGKTLLELFDDPVFDNVPDDFDFPKLDIVLQPADFS